MALSEFALIRKYFQQAGLMAEPALHAGVALGIGDDCALLEIPAEQQLAISLDMLVCGVHFPADADPARLARRALAVNLSDLAAMGAAPLGFTLGLAMPAVDETWLQQFASGLRQSAMQYGCPLLGGDTTAGPLQLTLQVHGVLPKGSALRRDGASVGDDVYVSGVLGRAGLALSLLDGSLPSADALQQRELLAAYYEPEPRLALGQALRGIASAAQDVSDGLLADLGHIARNSGVGMRLDAAAIPVAPVLQALCTPARALQLALTAGDEYELVFTAAPHRRDAVLQAAMQSGIAVSRIGAVCSGSAVNVFDAAGALLPITETGYLHFR